MAHKASGFCPLKVDRSETNTVCSAYGTKPTDRRRCTAEVKAAALVAANYIRKDPRATMDNGCMFAGIWPNQLVGEWGYFESMEHIRSTPMDTIPKRRSGTDPGEVEMEVAALDAAGSGVIYSGHIYIEEKDIASLDSGALTELLESFTVLFDDLKFQVDMVSKAIIIRKKEEKANAREIKAILKRRAADDKRRAAEDKLLVSLGHAVA